MAGGPDAAFLDGRPERAHEAAQGGLAEVVKDDQRHGDANERQRLARLAARPQTHPAREPPGHVAPSRTRSLSWATWRMRFGSSWVPRRMRSMRTRTASISACSAKIFAAK